MLCKNKFVYTAGTKATENSINYKNNTMGLHLYIHLVLKRKWHGETVFHIRTKEYPTMTSMTKKGQMMISKLIENGLTNWQLTRVRLAQNWSGTGSTTWLITLAPRERSCWRILSKIKILKTEIDKTISNSHLEPDFGFVGFLRS